MKNLDPDRMLARIFAERPARMVALLLTLYGVFSLFHLYVAGRSAAITADPYTYLAFARSLADGTMRFQGVLGEAMQAFAENEDIASGPVWNVNLLPGGEPVYTVAVGYPLFLAAMFKLGGYWLYTHINILLLALLSVLLLLCVRDGLKGSLFAWCAAGMACLLLMRSHPPSWLRFSYPWREPLYLVCLLGCFHALQRFAKGGRLRWVALAGLVLGYAVAIKEPNAIYGPVLGLYLLCTPGFRNHPRKAAVLALFVATGLIGVAPLLIQNITTTGHPLVSLQMARETQPFYEDADHSSLSPVLAVGNIDRYRRLYRTFPLFALPFVTVAGLGVLVSLRTGLGRVMLGLLVVHLLLYLQWGGFDVRHMYTAHLPYAVFLAWGFVWLAQQVARRIPGLGRFEHGLLLLPLFLAAVWPSQSTLPRGGAGFGYRDARDLVKEIESRTGENAVVLSNRILRDVIGGYSKLEVVRLHDLAMFHPERDVHAVLDWLRERETAVYFLDNTDMDPRNRNIIDWSQSDTEWLLDRHDLEPAFALTPGEFPIRGMTEREALTGYRVWPWRHEEVVRDLAVPEDGAAFLYLNLRGLEESVDIDVQGVSHARPETPFLPLHEHARTDALQVSVHAGGELLPALSDVRVVGWNETLRQELGADASPRDAWVFPTGLPPQMDSRFRYIDTPFRLRVPIRQTEDSFTALMLTGGLPRDTNVNLFVEWEGQAPTEFGFMGDYVWMPLQLPVQGQWAGIAQIHITSDAPAMAKLYQLTAVPVHRTLRYQTASDTLGAGLTGFLMAEQISSNPQPWSATLNGRLFAQGRCFSDPRRSINRFRHILTKNGVEPEIELRVEGAGLLQTEWVEVGTHLVASPETPEAVFVESGIRPPEGQGDAAFWWTLEETLIWVPVSAGQRHYELTLDLLDVRPGPEDRLRIEVGGQEALLVAPKERTELKQQFVVEASTAGLQPLRLQGPTWIPRDTLPESTDTRTLGLRLYRLTWSPSTEVRID